MARVFLLRSALLGLALFAAAGTEAADSEKSKEEKAKTSGTVYGILVDRKDNTITVKLDGKDEPVAFVADGSNKNLMKAFNKVFTVARVRLSYKTDGEEKKLLNIQRVGRQGTGTMTGTVLATHGWWVEVKTRTGSPEGFAATYPKERWKATEEKIKELRKGDVVTIRYYTDFERARILSIQKNAK